MPARRSTTASGLLALSLLLPAVAQGQTLLDLANAELHLADVCPSGATVGIYGSPPELVGYVMTDVLQTNADVTVVERARLDEVLAEFEAAPYLDPATAPAPGQLVMAKTLVLVEADISNLPADLSVSMVRTDTQDVVYEHSSVITEEAGFDGFEATFAEIAQAIAAAAMANNYACPRIGSLSYRAAVEGTDWTWDIAGYFDVLIRESGVAGELEAILRHVPTTNEVSGLLVSATPTQFPPLPAMTVTAQSDPGNPQGQPTSYLIQFQDLGVVGANHTLVFDEPPNPVFNTGRQNEQGFPNLGAVALGQWMRRNGNPALQLDAPVTGVTPDTWTQPAGQGTMTLTWVLP